jgi:GDSL-like lipase/acylhydrolase family protein
MHLRRPARLAAALALATVFAGAPAPTASGDRDVAVAATPVLVVGDSLAVGLEPYLGPMLGARPVSWNVVSGRTTPQGLFALRAMLRRVTPQTIVISLGTNDGPSPARFRDRIERVLAAAPPGACVVWTTVIRAPRKGPYHGLNAALHEEARRHSRLVLVDWARAVASGRVALPDGVHPDPDGFFYRSQMIAGGIARGC